MAYKSQVTNKYMGSSFAGRVNPGRENELTQLAKSLDQFADAFPRGVSAYKGNKVEEAEEVEAVEAIEEVKENCCEGKSRLAVICIPWPLRV